MSRPLAISFTTALLLQLVGCASSSNRQSFESDSNAPVDHVSPAEPVVAASPSDDSEFVLGSTFDHEALPVYSTPVSSLSVDEIRAELEAMYEHDRELVRASYADEQDPEAIRTVQAIDQAHADRLKEIVDQIGWPTRDLVGLKATQAAYMVIQHAGHDVDFQNSCLAMMVDLVKQGELPASYVALLTDRIRVFSDQPQVFGTQMKMSRNELGVMIPVPTVPIEDPANLNDRRALMGMVPHEQFVEAIQIAYQASVSEPNSAFASVSTDSD
ncbi:MAG: DUF6624 domain-containing protein [Phycisphaerales bacterium]